MEAKQYTISEAAKKLHVGSHVLRFWEEELHLNIPRNEMGHRVYSEKEMKQLEQIINMKKDGFSLKDIEHKPYPVSESEISPNDKMIQFKTILSRIVSDAIRENSDSLTSDIADTVSVQVNKELDYLFREKEESDEKRFRELDETIRSYQKARQEIAATQITANKAKKRHVFGKK